MVCTSGYLKVTNRRTVFEQVLSLSLTGPFLTRKMEAGDIINAVVVRPEAVKGMNWSLFLLFSFNLET
jgi:hypothetical protein